MGDIIKFTSPAGTPTFVGKGSKLEHPDILPVFWGPYWPGGGAVNTGAIMQAIRSVCSGPYLNGLKQYGYAGPPSVRNEMIVSSMPGIAPAPQPTLAAVASVVRNKLIDMLDNDEIDNVDDNHDLIVMFFLDPSIPQPVGASGANNSIEEFEFLDDNTRFEYCWISTASGSLSSVTQTFSHELVESITDPFGTGWEQVSPTPPANQGQIGDVCNQPAMVDGVSVAAYWSSADGFCIVPTSGIRSVFLTYELKVPTPKDGPERQAYVDFGKLCTSGFFDYHERTYQNTITIRANLSGYELPTVGWTINGQIVPFLSGSILVDAQWENPPVTRFTGGLQFHKPMATLLTSRTGPVTELTILVGPDEGNVSLAVACSVTESFDNTAGGGIGSSIRNATVLIDVKNQELIWGEAYKEAKQNCDRIHHLSAGGGPVVGIPTPGDPPDLAQILLRLIREGDLSRVADLIRDFGPETANALSAYAERAARNLRQG